jgi:glucose/arabinose dehydrogenase
MRIIILIAITILSLNAKDKIEVVGLDDSKSYYNLDEIENITFDFENPVNIEVTFTDNEKVIYQLTSSDEIYFENGDMMISKVNEMISFEMDLVQSMRFESNFNDNRYPFGDLEIDEIIVDGLSNPWSLDFIDNNTIIFTELNAKLQLLNISTGELTEIGGLPFVRVGGQGGLLDVTLHPNFDDNKLVYLAYSTGPAGQFTTAVGRGTLVDNNLENFEEIFRGSRPTGAGVHFGSRVVFDNDGKLYFSIGDRGEQNTAQDSTNHNGSVMRINDDGSVPSDNPFVNTPGAQPEVYTMGNRNIQGMFYNPENDELWAIEHGPRGGDELNLIQSGKNYSWPLATYGINYDGTPITELRSIPGHIDPITYWVPSVAPCGMDLVNYDSENNELDIIIGTLAAQHLHRIKVRNYEVVETVRILEGYGRFRDVQMSPDGYLYAAVQGPGTIIRLKAKD